MSEQLPPELSRLGDEICAAAERSVDARRRRGRLIGRLATTAVGCAVAFAVLEPGALGPAERSQELVELASLPAAAGAIYLPRACEQPRAATFADPRPCAAPGATRTRIVLRRPYAWR